MKKNILITGASGKIGSKILQWLIEYQPINYEKIYAQYQYQTINTKHNIIKPIQWQYKDHNEYELIKKLQLNNHAPYIDLWINCIGIFQYKPLTEQSSHDWDNIIKTNLILPLAIYRGLTQNNILAPTGKIWHLSYEGIIEPLKIKDNILPYQIADTGIDMLWQGLKKTDNRTIINQKIGISDLDAYHQYNKTNKKVFQTDSLKEVLYNLL